MKSRPEPGTRKNAGKGLVVPRTVIATRLRASPVTAVTRA